MGSLEELKFIMANEVARNTFFQNFTPGSTLTKEQIDDLGPKNVERVEKLAKDILWASMERRSLVSTIGTPIEEYFLKAEDDMPPVDTFLPDESSKAELEAAQDGVWAQTVRIVAERNLTNGVEIMELYDQLNQPYFRFTWLEACKAREDIQCCRLPRIDEEVEALGSAPTIVEIE